MSTIQDIEHYFASPLPRCYREFLLSHHQEMDGDVYLYLVSDLVERNECYETRLYAPGYINIGDNHGGMAFILELSQEDPEVFVVDHGSMAPELKESLNLRFSQWWASGFNYSDE